MTLYSSNGGYPAPLPFRIWLPATDDIPFVHSRTDPTQFLPEDIAIALDDFHQPYNFVEAPDAPEYDPETQTLGWDGSAWTVT